TEHLFVPTGRPTPPMAEAPPVKARPFVFPAVSHAPPAPPSLGVLASYPGMERDPSFSPDGSKVAFAWQHGGMRGYAIYGRDVQGDDSPVAVTSGRFEDWGPTWSPDGRRIAFRRRYGNDGIYLVNAKGGPEQLLAHSGRWVFSVVLAAALLY